MKKIVFITVLVLAAAGTVFAAGKIVFKTQFRKEVENLFSGSEKIRDRVFSLEQISGIPDPVQKYFRHVLKEGQSYISYVRLQHDGFFKPAQDKAWVSIKGEQYFTCGTPGFVWKADTSMFSVRDMYINNSGRIVVSLFSLFKVVDGSGPEYDQGELLRWLGESVWFPTNLLPSENLKWLPIDSGTAELRFIHNGMSLSYRVSFNDNGEIVQIETKRYMGEDGLKTWIGRVGDYKEINGIIIPTRIEAVWKLETGEFSYARFNVTAIEYERPEQF